MRLPGNRGRSTPLCTIYGKLGLRSRAQAVNAALGAGLIGKDGRWMK